MSSLAQMSFGPPEPPYEEIGCFGEKVGGSVHLRTVNQKNDEEIFQWVILEMRKSF